MRATKLLLAFVLSPLMLTAQPSMRRKQAVQVSCGELCWNLRYSDNGLLSDIHDGSREDARLLWNYRYDVPVDDVPHVIQYGYSRPQDLFYPPEGQPTFIRWSELNSDRLISNDRNTNQFLWCTTEDYDFEYTDGRIAKITGSEGVVVHLSWDGGNLTQIVFAEDGEEAGHIFCSYSGVPAKGVCRALNSPLFLLLHYYGVQSLGPLVNGYYGLLSQNLLSEMNISFSKKFLETHSFVSASEDSFSIATVSHAYYPITERKSRSYAYETDADGYVIRMTVFEGENSKDYLLEYANETPVNSVTKDNSGQATSLQQACDLLGRRLNGKPATRGLYINDGKKVLITK